jgi:hypothetical protein
MDKTCWICFQACSNDTKCNCQNEYAFCHNNCLRKWVMESNKKKCIFCKAEYKFPFYFLLWVYICNYIKIIYDLHLEICEYNLYNGSRWDDE